MSTELMIDERPQNQQNRLPFSFPSTAAPTVPRSSLYETSSSGAGAAAVCDTEEMQVLWLSRSDQQQPPPHQPIEDVQQQQGDVYPPHCVVDIPPMTTATAAPSRSASYVTVAMPPHTPVIAGSGAGAPARETLSDFQTAGGINSSINVTNNNLVSSSSRIHRSRSSSSISKFNADTQNNNTLTPEEQAAFLESGEGFDSNTAVRKFQTPTNIASSSIPSHTPNQSASGTPTSHELPQTDVTGFTSTTTMTATTVSVPPQQQQQQQTSQQLRATTGRGGGLNLHHHSPYSQKEVRRSLRGLRRSMHTITGGLFNSKFEMRKDPKAFRSVKGERIAQHMRHILWNAPAYMDPHQQWRWGASAGGADGAGGVGFGGAGATSTSILFELDTSSSGESFGGGGRGGGGTDPMARRPRAGGIHADHPLDTTTGEDDPDDGVMINQYYTSKRSLPLIYFTVSNPRAADASRIPPPPTPSTSMNQSEINDAFLLAPPSRGGGGPHSPNGGEDALRFVGTLRPIFAKLEEVPTHVRCYAGQFPVLPPRNMVVLHDENVQPGNAMDPEDIDPTVVWVRPYAVVPHFYHTTPSLKPPLTSSATVTPSRAHGIAAGQHQRLQQAASAVLPLLEAPTSWTTMHPPPTYEPHSLTTNAMMENSMSATHLFHHTHHQPSVSRRVAEVHRPIPLFHSRVELPGSSFSIAALTEDPFHLHVEGHRGSGFPVSGNNNVRESSVRSINSALSDRHHANDTPQFAAAASPTQQLPQHGDRGDFLSSVTGPSPPVRGATSHQQDRRNSNEDDEDADEPPSPLRRLQASVASLMSGDDGYNMMAMGETVDEFWWHRSAATGDYVQRLILPWYDHPWEVERVQYETRAAAATLAAAEMKETSTGVFTSHGEEEGAAAQGPETSLGEVEGPFSAPNGNGTDTAATIASDQVQVGSSAVLGIGSLPSWRERARVRRRSNSPGARNGISGDAALSTGSSNHLSPSSARNYLTQKCISMDVWLYITYSYVSRTEFPAFRLVCRGFNSLVVSRCAFWHAQLSSASLFGLHSDGEDVSSSEDEDAATTAQQQSGGGGGADSDNLSPRTGGGQRGGGGQQRLRSPVRNTNAAAGVTNTSFGNSNANNSRRGGHNGGAPRLTRCLVHKIVSKVDSGGLTTQALRDARCQKGCCHAAWRREHLEETELYAEQFSEDREEEECASVIQALLFPRVGPPQPATTGTTRGTGWHPFSTSDVQMSVGCVLVLTIIMTLVLAALCVIFAMQTYDNSTAAASNAYTFWLAIIVALGRGGSTTAAPVDPDASSGGDSGDTVRDSIFISVWIMFPTYYVLLYRSMCWSGAERIITTILNSAAIQLAVVLAAVYSIDSNDVSFLACFAPVMVSGGWQLVSTLLELRQQRSSEEGRIALSRSGTLMGLSICRVLLCASLAVLSLTIPYHLDAVYSDARDSVRSSLTPTTSTPAPGGPPPPPTPVPAATSPSSAVTTASAILTVSTFTMSSVTPSYRFAVAVQSLFSSLSVVIPIATACCGAMGILMVAVYRIGPQDVLEESPFALATFGGYIAGCGLTLISVAIAFSQSTPSSALSHATSPTTSTFSALMASDYVPQSPSPINLGLFLCVVVVFALATCSNACACYFQTIIPPQSRSYIAGRLFL